MIMQQLGKRPRHYFEDYLNARTNTERDAVIKSVPDIYKTWVSFYIDDRNEKLQYKMPYPHGAKF